MKQCIDRSWTLLMLFVMLLCLGMAMLFPNEVNAYENRPAYQMPALHFDALLSGDFQDALEQMLSDQIPGSELLEKEYHKRSNGLTLNLMHTVAGELIEQPIAFQGMEFYDSDYILYPTVWLDMRQDALDRKTQNYNALIAAHPELVFFVYYIEKDTDIDFPSGTRTGVSDYVLQHLELPEDHKAAFQVQSFSDFQNWFYKTDHHWNYEGSYQGYRQVMALLGRTDLLLPDGPDFIAGGMSGSKALLSGTKELITEDFYAYRYDFPPMEITINGKTVSDYGNQNGTYEAGAISYGAFYGGDDGEICFRTQNEGAGNLLVIGESFDNALLKLLASGFENTCSIDLRNYEQDTGRPFYFSAYVTEHNIDTVLFIGNMDFYSMDEFLLEDGA